MNRRLTLISVLALLGLLALLSALPAGAGLPPNNQPQSTSAQAGAPATTKLDPSAWAKIEPLVLKQLDQQGATTFIVYLADQADLKPLQRMKAGASRRQAVVQTLQATAEASQRDIRAFLDRQQAAGHVTDYLPFWVFNGLAVTGNAETLYALAARPDVANIRANHVRRLPEPSFVPDDSPTEVPVVWNVDRVRAPHAWQEFGITGKGVVVGSMDTGVQWTHPALHQQYRGAAGDHDYNWFDFTGTYPRVPADGHGHGTHTTGTAVGGKGAENHIGVAPGAQWIAVKVFSDSGTAKDVDLHRAFQWMLAPTDLNGENPDPSRAPDVVNNSWGSGYPDADPSFWPDVAAWRAAGIFSSFSAGNEGDLGDGSVGTPGSFPISFSVGATDADERIAAFSSRGPSFWGEIKPDVSAPGAAIRSSIPTDSYGVSSGTSMAAPHVAGLAALLLEANPKLTVNDLEEFVRRTAVDRGPAGADNTFGWGRIDAYQAVRWALSAGRLTGTVSRFSRFSGSGESAESAESAQSAQSVESAESAQSAQSVESAGSAQSAQSVESAGSAQSAQSADRVAGATVGGLNQNTGDQFTATTDANGIYTVSVPAGVYTVTASAFGYLPASVGGVEVISGFLSVQDLALKPAPTGTLAGRVTEARTGRPLAATVGVPGAPASTTTDAEGRYTLTLPAGAHTLTIAAPGYRQVTTPVSITQGQTLALNVELQRVPSILLVDADTWVGTNQTLYYRRALDELGYPYDVHLIADTTNDVPTGAELAAYDIVIWVHPWSSPGYIDGRVREDTATVDALRAYLNGGGRLMIIGQDIGYWDSAQGPSTARLAPAFYAEYLNAIYIDDDAGSRSLTGVPDEFLSGVQITLEDVYGYKWGADLAPDHVRPADRSGAQLPTIAVPILSYDNNRIGGLRVSGGAYRLAYLAFGLEGAGPRPGLTETISRTLTWLGQPTFTKRVDRATVSPGATLTYTLEAVNPMGLNLPGVALLDPLPAEVAFVPGSVTGGAGYDATANAVHWSGDLAPRQALTVTFQATVASPLRGGTVITNTATLDDGRGGLLTAAVTTTVVGPDLSTSRKVVSHARANPGEVLTYTLTLTNLASAAAPDVQLTDPIPAGARYVAGSVTGGATYDPIANRIEWTGTVPGQAHATPNYTWRDSDTPGGPTFEWVDISTIGTAITGLGDDTNLGPFGIGFAFPFYGRSFTSFRVCSNGWLSFDSTATAYNNRRLPATDAPRNLIAPFWDDLTFAPGGRVLFWSNSFDTLVVTYEGVPRFGNQGPYTFQVILRADGSITYQYLSMGTPTDSATIGVQNADGTQGLTIAHNQTYVHDRLAILISPPVPPPPPPRITFQVEVDPQSPGHTAIVNRAVVTDSAGVTYTLAASTLVRPADLSTSDKVAEPRMTMPGGIVTYLITLRNRSTQTAPAVTVSDSLPAEVELVPGSVTGGAAYDPPARLITWSGPVPGGEEHAISFAARVKPTVSVGTRFVNVATVDDGLSPAFTVSAEVAVGLADLSRSRKVVDRAVARSGDELRYTINLTNTGQLAATGVTIVDPLPEGTTYVLDSVTGGASYDSVANAIRWQGDVPARGFFTWQDSTAPGGPAFKWVDVTTIGTGITGLGDDVNVGPLPIGFEFPFFGQRFTQFYFSTNGFISFSPIAGGHFVNRRLPDPSAPGNLLTIFWDDLTFVSQGRAYYWSNGADTLVVSYVGVPHLSSGGPYTFQAILKADGTITYQYLAMVSRLQEATIGLQNADGSEGLTVVHDAPYVTDRLAIRFLPPESQMVSFRVTVNPDLPLEAVITNTATVDGSLYLGETGWGPLTLSASTLVNTVDLGASRLEVSRETARPGDRLAYAMHVLNNGVIPAAARVSIPIPEETTFVAGSVTGGAAYDPATNQVTWAGTVPPQSPSTGGAETTFGFATVTALTLPNGARVRATATVEDGMHAAFTRVAETRILAPDFSGSQKVADRAMAGIGEVIGYSVVVQNSGDAEATTTVTDVLPVNLEYVPDSASAGTGSQPRYDPIAHQLTWQGAMPARSQTTLGFAGRVVNHGSIVNRAFIDDGRGVVVEREARTEPAGVVLAIPAARGAAGYVTSENRLGNYLGQREMYTGVDDRPQRPTVLHGVVQFDLSSIPADAVLIAAQVEFSGLDRKFMSADAEGTWYLHLLDGQVDARWAELGYWHIHNARVAETVSPALSDADLGPGRVNVFTFSPGQLAALAERLQTTGRASFRLDGVAGRLHLRHIFAWDAHAPPILRVIYTR